MTASGLTRAAKSRVIIVFSLPMNAKQAANARRYQIRTVLANGGPGVTLRLARVKYTAGSRTVSLTLAGKVTSTDRLMLTITASGLTGSNGVVLDGDNNGTPGGNYVTMFL